MNLPETEISAERSSPGVVQADEGWGDLERRRQIALLEAHLLQERLNHTLDAIEEEHRSGSGAEESTQRWINLAVQSIINDVLEDVGIKANALRDFSARARVYAHRLRHHLGSALVIRQLQIIKRVCSALLIRLRKAAESALYSLPLFAYGPELSEFRHRYR